MNLFQIVTICFGFASIVTGLVMSYTSTMVAIAKIQVQIKNLEHMNDEREKAILKLETNNTTEHKEIIERLNRLIEK